MLRSMIVRGLICALGLVLVAVPATGQGHWEAVVGDTAVVGNGFGDMDNQGAGAMAVFGDWLYVVAGGDTGQASQLWRTANGVDWDQILPDGFGDANNQGASAMIVWGGYLYVGTTNLNGAQILRSDDGANWSLTAMNGPWTNNRAVTDFAIAGSMLVVGTENEVTGGEIWKTEDGTTWTQMMFGGFQNLSNRAVASLEWFSGRLYAGTFKESALYNQPGEIWWTDDFMNWFHQLPDGFGDTYNVAMASMVVYEGSLYVGTSQPNFVFGNGCEVWVTDGAAWTIAGANGFGSAQSTTATRFAEFLGILYVGVDHQSTGARVLRMRGPVDWVEDVDNGYGEASNLAVGSMAVFRENTPDAPSHLYVGTLNQTLGCEVWRQDEAVLKHGFDATGDFTGWSGVVN